MFVNVTNPRSLQVALAGLPQLLPVLVLVLIASMLLA